MTVSMAVITVLHLQRLYTFTMSRGTHMPEFITDMNPLGLNPKLSMRGRGITRLVDGDDIHGPTTAFQAAP